ncbi:unnamed protein product [Nezara viridula]|uniref:Uncharacterized protein n=1 Tax=Nezara viridula TaxID=85310 RepID=A0A9P0HRZ8_NEZVI|nr:unnamed protein product [Nezara viridula]
MAMDKLWCEYCSNATIHGIKLATTPKRPLVERIFWLVIIIVSTCLTADQVWVSWVQYRSYPLQLVEVNSRTNLMEFEFPAVTICSLIKLKVTRVRSIKNLKLRVYSAMMKQVLTNGYETWTLNRTLEKTIERFGRKILLTITGAIWDQSTNTWRRKINNELLTETDQSISQDMKARRLRLARHVARRNPSGNLYVTMNASIESKIPRG